MSLALIVKALPFLWPFLRESLKKPKTGGPAGRSKRPWRLIVIGLFLVLFLVVRHVSTLNDQNEALEKKLQELTLAIQKVPPPVTQQAITPDHVELRLCQQQYQSLMGDFRIAEADKERAQQDVAKLTAELAQCKAPPVKRIDPVKPKSNAADRLEKLEDKEGIQ